MKASFPTVSPWTAAVRRIETNDRSSCEIMRMNGWRRKPSSCGWKVTVYVSVAREGCTRLCAYGLLAEHRDPKHSLSRASIGAGTGRRPTLPVFFCSFKIWLPKFSGIAPLRLESCKISQPSLGRDYFKLEVEVSAVVQTHCFSLVFELLQKIRIHVTAALDLLPGEDFVVSGNDVLQCESALPV